MSAKTKSKWQESGGRARLAASAATALQRQNISVTSSTAVSSDPGQVVQRYSSTLSQRFVAVLAESSEGPSGQ